MYCIFCWRINLKQINLCHQTLRFEIEGRRGHSRTSCPDTRGTRTGAVSDSYAHKPQKMPEKLSKSSNYKFSTCICKYLASKSAEKNTKQSNFKFSTLEYITIFQRKIGFCSLRAHWPTITVLIFSNRFLMNNLLFLPEYSRIN